MSPFILSVLTWGPVAGGIAVLAIGDRRAAIARWLALLTSLVTLLHSGMLWHAFDRSTGAFQFIERVPWIGALHSDYYLGVDGISLPLIVLTAFMTPLVIIAAWNVIEKRPAQYFA